MRVSRPCHQASRVAGGSFTTSPRPMSIHNALSFTYARAQVIAPGRLSPANVPQAHIYMKAPAPDSRLSHLAALSKLKGSENVGHFI